MPQRLNFNLLCITVWVLQTEEPWQQKTHPHTQKADSHSVNCSEIARVHFLDFISLYTFLQPSSVPLVAQQILP